MRNTVVFDVRPGQPRVRRIATLTTAGTHKPILVPTLSASTIDHERSVYDSDPTGGQPSSY